MLNNFSTSDRKDAVPLLSQRDVTSYPSCMRRGKGHARGVDYSFRAVRSNDLHVTGFEQGLDLVTHDRQGGLTGKSEDETQRRVICEMVTALL